MNSCTHSLTSLCPPCLQVCGHRFVKVYGAHELRSMIGQCYLRGNNLQYDKDDDLNWQKPDQPCK